MTISLDTSAVIDILRNKKRHVRQRFYEAESEAETIVLSSFVLHELLFGAMTSPMPAIELELIDRFVTKINVEPWTAEDAIVSARVRTEMKTLGSPIGAVDGLIGGQAVGRGWRIVTSNVRHFIRIPGLTVIDWSDPAGARTMDAKTWSRGLSRRPPEE
jgi:tRNA(fMet)-specific endonuclease VapC